MGSGDVEREREIASKVQALDCDHGRMGAAIAEARQAHAHDPAALGRIGEALRVAREVYGTEY